MRLILWLFILIFVFVCLPTVEGIKLGKSFSPQNVQKSVSKATNTVSKNITSAATTALKAVAVGVGAGSLIPSNPGGNNRPASIPVILPVQPRGCVDQTERREWYKIRNLKPGETPKVSGNVIRCNYAQFPPSTKLKECIQSTNPVKFPIQIIKRHKDSLDPDDNPNRRYFMSHPKIARGRNNPCKWSYTTQRPDRFKRESDISNTLVTEEVPEDQATQV